MHRLTQAILRDRLTAEQAAATRAGTEAMLAAVDPGSPRDPVSWPRWAQLVPHLLAADLAATSNSELRSAACNACRYLMDRGDTRTAHDLAAELLRHWRGRLGDDHDNTRAVADQLAWALRSLGRYAEARGLAQETLARRHRVFGEDHPYTLESANNLGNTLPYLGEYQAARDLHQDTLNRRRQVLGEDHPSTLDSASSLADLRALARRDGHPLSRPTGGPPA